MSAWEVVGWAGSALLVFSLLQTGMVRLRVLNLLGCAVATAYNLAIGVWPSVGLNVALAVINIVQLVRLRRASRDSSIAEEPRGRPTLA